MGRRDAIQKKGEKHTAGFSRKTSTNKTKTG